jgi:sugar lactone lactonase YvrE
MTGLALDEESGHAYVSRFDDGTILRVDLETEAVEAITSSGDGLLESVSDILLDLPNQRLLAVDTATDAIVAIDTVTLQKDLISRDGDRGMGPAFATPASITMTPDGTLYVADQATNEILSVDPDTGDRTIYETTCSFTTPESLSRAIYLEDTNEFLIRADGVFAVNRDTSVCRTEAGLQRSPLDVVVTSEGQILAADFNEVLQIDRPTGDLVIVSR